MQEGNRDDSRVNTQCGGATLLNSLHLVVVRMAPRPLLLLLLAVGDAAGEGQKLAEMYVASGGKVTVNAGGNLQLNTTNDQVCATCPACNCAACPACNCNCGSGGGGGGKMVSWLGEAEAPPDINPPAGKIYLTHGFARFKYRHYGGSSHRAELGVSIVAYKASGSSSWQCSGYGINTGSHEQLVDTSNCMARSLSQSGMQNERIWVRWNYVMEYEMVA